MPLEVIQIPLLKDNYSYLLRDSLSGVTAVVDPSQAEPVSAVINNYGGRLDYILNTHHHYDHSDGNLSLKSRFVGVRVLAGVHDKGRLPGLDTSLNEGDELMIGYEKCQVLYTPGHTRGHVVYWFQKAKKIFTGDTMFSLGCGAIFEGTREEMWQSLQRIRELPDATNVYCGHEYTDYFLGFALTLEPDRHELLAKKAEVDWRRARGLSTIPSLLGEEKRLNPFLRADDPALMKKLGMEAASPQEVFARILDLEMQL